MTSAQKKPHLALLLLPCLLTAVPARAEEPFILPGREAQVMHLFAPFDDGRPIADGWTLGSVSIDRSVIRVALTREGGTATVELRHASALEGTPVGGFRVVESGGVESEAARAALLVAVGQKDGADLWSQSPPPSPPNRLHSPWAGFPAERPSPWLPLSLALVAVLVSAAGVAMRPTRRKSGGGRRGGLDEARREDR